MRFLPFLAFHSINLYRLSRGVLTARNHQMPVVFNNINNFFENDAKFLEIITGLRTRILSYCEIFFYARIEIRLSPNIIVRCSPVTPKERKTVKK